jgi:hypothetical protein
MNETQIITSLFKSVHLSLNYLDFSIVHFSNSKICLLRGSINFLRGVKKTSVLRGLINFQKGCKMTVHQTPP